MHFRIFSKLPVQKHHVQGYTQDVMAALWSHLCDLATSQFGLVGRPPPVSPVPFYPLSLGQPRVVEEDEGRDPDVEREEVALLSEDVGEVGLQEAEEEGLVYDQPESQDVAALDEAWDDRREDDSRLGKEEQDEEGVIAQGWDVGEAGDDGQAFEQDFGRWGQGDDELAFLTPTQTHRESQIEREEREWEMHRQREETAERERERARRALRYLQSTSPSGPISPANDFEWGTGNLESRPAAPFRAQSRGTEVEKKSGGAFRVGWMKMGLDRFRFGQKRGSKQDKQTEEAGTKRNGGLERGGESPMPHIVRRVDAFMRKCSNSGGSTVLDVSVLDLSHLVDNRACHLAYALGRLARASPNIQHLNLKGFTALSQASVFPALLSVLRAVPSLWAMNLDGVYFNDQQMLAVYVCVSLGLAMYQACVRARVRPCWCWCVLLVCACARANSCPRQRLQVLQAVSHSRVSHVALPVCAKEHQDSLLNFAATNSKRHSLWRLGGDPTQNQVILEINGYCPQR